MNIEIKESNIRTLRHGDPNFFIVDGLTVAARAGFEISIDCPKEYKLILQICIQHGWIKPIANVNEKELTIAGLLK
jgi:hypothetical protein